MEHVQAQDKALVLYAVSKMGKLTTTQVKRVLEGSGVEGTFDMAWALAELCEAGQLSQSVDMSGIVYEVTPAGAEALARAEIAADVQARIDSAAETYAAIFQKESIYLAQYTEQANAIVPVFLSIRTGDKVLFKVSIIVHDTETAIKIKENWIKNADKTYKAVWDSIGEGEPTPTFAEIGV